MTGFNPVFWPAVSFNGELLEGTVAGGTTGETSADFEKLSAKNAAASFMEMPMACVVLHQDQIGYHTPSP